jgi:hypothetical protein
MQRSVGAASGGRQEFLDQSVVFSTERINETDAPQGKTVLQILGQQMPHARSPRTNPQHGVPERQAVRFHGIVCGMGSPAAQTKHAISVKSRATG